MLSRLLITLLVGTFSLPLARGDAAPRSNGQLGEVHNAIHVVHLRTGTIDADAAQKRLPPPTSTARRLLQQRSSATPSPPTTSPEWGPLAGSQLWLLTLGPSLHWQEADQQKLLLTVAASQQAQLHSQRHPRISNRPAPSQHLVEAQSLLRSALHRAGAALVAFLPPAAWLLAVAERADLAPLLEAFPDVRLAPYGPPNMRVSPELAAVLDLMRVAGEAVAERIAAGERLDELLQEARAEQSAWLLGAMRTHLPTHGSLGAGGSSRSSSASGSPTTTTTTTVRRRVQVEVHFPHLEPEDRDVLLAAPASVRQSDGGPGRADDSSSDSSRPATGDRRRWRAHAYHPASAAAADWLAPLAALSPPDCPPLLEPDFGSPELLLVGVCPEALAATVEWLAETPQVSWLSPRMSSRLHNLVAGAIVQTGGLGNGAAARYNASVPSAHPFWLAGLDGRNQTVGCGDSGLDFGNCFFYDNTVDVSKTQIDSATGMQYFYSDAHRKLRSYLALVQDMVDSFGHGTHVAGTLVGSKNDKTNFTDDPVPAGTGQAPAAKIAFLDLSRGSSDGVWTPGDLYRSYFNLSYRVGARVHSDSWGSELTAYDSMSASLDRFTFANQDFVSVFAAGNYGDKSAGSTRGTVTSPAVAKNCIAVGATLSVTPSGTAGGFYRSPWVAMSNMTVNLDLPGQTRFTRSVRVVKAGFGGDLDLAAPASGGGIQLVVANPEDACAGLANAGAVNGRVVLVQRGGCYFTEKARNAAAAGAKAVIVYNDVKDSGYFAMSPSSDYVNSGVALGSVPLSTGTWLKGSVDAGIASVSFSKIDKSPADYPAFEDIASYSSVGPTTDGRIKPDIVAPGTLLSANSSRSTPVFGSPGSCSSSVALTSMSGTSMATPVVAGSALLIRQYFTDGYYPDGVSNPANSFAPSGPLIKAVMLGGAQHMAGVVADTGMPLEDGPSYRQGFGRLSLAHSLPLPLTTNPTNNPGWRMQVVDGAALSTGQQHQFCVTALGGPLRITLAWYDYPAELAAARALVNNLDLQVRAAGRGLVADYGNGAPDVVNTVEQVWYDNLPPGDVAITVVATSIFQKALQQAYALVVQGNFSGRLPGRTGPDPSTGSTNMCAAQLAVIDDDMSSPPITNSNNLTFYFRTQDGSTPSAGFQCRLALESGNATSPSPSGSGGGGWTACASPLINYPNKPEGRYSFQVRVSGEQVAASRSVLVDTTPPVITLVASLPDGAATDGTPSDNATFTFSATDATSAVTFTCRIDFFNGPRGAAFPAFLRFGPSTAASVVSAAAAAANSSGGAGNGSVPVRTTFACGSPLELNGMTYGDYQLLVSAKDAAGNRVDAPPKTWKVRYNATVLYARLASGTMGLAATRDLRYRVVGFQGAAAANTPPEQLGLAGGGQGYEYTAALMTATAGTGSSGPAAGSSTTLLDAASRATWSQLNVQDVTASVSTDGSYLVLVRPRLSTTDTVTWGVASVEVDTTPPNVTITLAPKAYQSDPRVTIKFADNGTDDDVRLFLCRWLNTSSPPAPDPATPEAAAPYLPCSRDGTAFNVSDGYWLFQVKGQDAAGNIGSPANVSFITDLQPPVINTSLPTVVNVSRLEWTYTLFDNGTGVANSSCVFRWVSLDNATVIADGDQDFPPASQKPDWASPCPNKPFRYTLQEGLYMWSIAATDWAGLKASLDRQLLADFSRPTSKANTGNRKKLPAKFTVYVTSRDLPKTINSGLLQQECRIDTASAPPPASPPPPPPSSPPPPVALSPPVSSLPPGSRMGAVSPATAAGGVGTSTTTSSSVGVGSGSRRLVQEQPPQQGGSPRLYNSSAIQLGAWHVCDPTGAAVNITYDNFSSGYYTFSVRALDKAGNLGSATEPLFFEVDASLPADGDQTVEVGAGGSGGSSNRTKKIVIGVAIVVGAVILVASAIAIVVARRRYLRKRYAGPPPPPLPAGGARGAAGSNGGGVIAMQPIPYANDNGNGNGYSNGHYNSHPAAPVVGLPTGGSLPPPTAAVAAGSYYHPAYPPPAALGRGGVVLAAPADPALAAALALSAAEAQQAQSAAAAAAADAERIRMATAASIEEENLRRAKEASLAAAQHAAAEQSAIDAAIAASLATADQERQRQQQRAQAAAASAAQAQHQQLPPSAPAAPPSRPPDYNLI